MSAPRKTKHGFASLQRSAERGFTVLKRSAEHGFTLLEMVVALAIFALAGMALVRLEGTTLTQSAQLADRAVGQTVARNLAVEILSDPALPAFGRSNGEAVNAGRRWRWQRDVTRTDDVRIARVDILVTDDSGHPAGKLSLAKAAQ